MSGARALRRAAATASRPKTAPLTTLSRNFADGIKPAGIIDVLTTPGAGPTVVSGVTLSEGPRISGTGGLNSFAVMPDVMASDLFSVTVTVGGLSSAANNRSVGPGVSNSDGTRAICVRLTSSSANATLTTYIDGVETDRDSLGSQSANTGNTITLLPSISAGVVTWTVLKNGVIIPGLEWTDSAHELDLPGSRPAVAFRRQYSGGANFGSRGITLVEAAVI